MSLWCGDFGAILFVDPFTKIGAAQEYGRNSTIPSGNGFRVVYFLGEPLPFQSLKVEIRIVLCSLTNALILICERHTKYKDERVNIID